MQVTVDNTNMACMSATVECPNCGVGIQVSFLVPAVGARKRWEGATKEEKLAQARRMVEGRKAKQANGAVGAASEEGPELSIPEPEKVAGAVISVSRRAVPEGCGQRDCPGPRHCTRRLFTCRVARGE